MRNKKVTSLACLFIQNKINVSLTYWYNCVLLSFEILPTSFCRCGQLQGPRELTARHKATATPLVTACLVTVILQIPRELFTDYLVLFFSQVQRL
jgi:hypothetical protein